MIEAGIKELRGGMYGIKCVPFTPAKKVKVTYKHGGPLPPTKS